VSDDGGLLEDLYKEILLDHYRNPRNKGSLDVPTCAADGANPLCGDQVTVEAKLDDNRIAEISFDGRGCSISQASASMMTEYVRGRTVEEARHGVEAFQRMMLEAQAPDEEGFEDIEALIGVAKFPARVKCASLAWKTLERALEGGGEITTDERSTSAAAGGSGDGGS
jgi:nitrogen fixation NifU-like protein